MATNESILEKPVKYASIFTALFLILEAGKIIFYYWLWGFNVIPYMTLSFYFSQFVGDIGLFLTITLIIVCAPAFAWILTNIVPKRKAGWFYVKLFFFIVGASLLFGWICGESFGKNIGVSAGLIIFFTLLFTFEYILKIPEIDKFTLKEIIAGFKKHYEENVGSAYDPNIGETPPAPKRKLENVAVPIFVISFLVVSGYNDMYHHDRLTNYRTLRKTEIMMNDSTFVHEESTEYYIGHTPEFYFTYNDTSKLVRVIKAENVKEVRIYKNNIYHENN